MGKKILKIAHNAPYEIKNSTLFYLQHGDAWYSNIIWQNDDEFTYIDLDQLGYWPAIYDIIYGLTVKFKEKAFSIIEYDLYKEIEILFNHFNISFSIDVLDCYYVEFLKIWTEKDPKIYCNYIKPFFALDSRFQQVHNFLTPYSGVLTLMN